jgi:hypothetical protein
LVLPGFVSTLAWETLVPSRYRDYSKSIVEFLGYSAVNYVLLAPAYVGRLSSWAAGDFTTFDFLLLPIITIVVPGLWPLGIYWIRRTWPTQLFRDPTPTAWDRAFRDRQTRWVIVHLKDGRRLPGYLGGKSYATEYPFEPSLFLEKLCTQEPDGSLRPVENSEGMVIPGEAIELVEFVQGGNNP